MRAGAQSLPNESTDGLHIVCSLDHPVIDPSKSATVSIYTDNPEQNSLNYEWSTSNGVLSLLSQSSSEKWGKKVQSSRAVWWPQGLEPGPYQLSATVTAPSVAGATGITRSCSVTIVVSHETRQAQVGGGARPLPAGPQGSGQRAHATEYGYQTWRSLLVRGQSQRPGFGLYSYMLLGAPPDQEAKERFLAFIKSYLDLIADVKGLESSRSPSALNITYLPIVADPPESVSPGWVLDHYDYSRARAILSSVPAARGRGPFIISATQPLDGSSLISTPNLVEDLSAKPTPVVEFWVNQFLIQTTQQQFWQSSSLRSVALNLRTAIAYAAEGYPIVQRAVAASFIFNPSR